MEKGCLEMYELEIFVRGCEYVDLGMYYWVGGVFSLGYVVCER